jgi:hypothetical protein
MHGFGDARVYQFLVGGEVGQVCMGAYGVSLICHPTGTIAVQQRLVHRWGGSVAGEVWSEATATAPTNLTRLLSARITAVESVAPGTLRISFSNGDEIDIIDEDERYEACVVGGGPSGIIVT